MRIGSMRYDLDSLTHKYEQMKALGGCMDYMAAKALRQPPPPAFTHNKAAVGAITTETASALRRELQPFVDVVIQQTVLGKLRGATVDAPPFSTIPAVVETPEVAWVGEGVAAPFARMGFTTVTTAPTKYVTLWATTKELFRFADARRRNLLIRVSTRTLSRAENLAFLGDDAGSSDRPAGILYNVAASGGGSPLSLADDLATLYAEVVDGQAEKPVFVTSGRVALWLAATGLQVFKDVKLADGTIAGAPLLISPAAANRLILLDAAELAATDDGLEIDSAEGVSIEMVDTPTVGATTLTSAFQANAVVLRFTRFVHWAKLRDDAAGFIEIAELGGSPTGSPA